MHSSELSIATLDRKHCIMATKEEAPTYIEDIKDGKSTNPSDNGKAGAATPYEVDWDEAEEKKLV